MIRTLDRPCWHLARADNGAEYHGGFDAAPHFDTEQQALDSDAKCHADHRGIAVQAVRYAAPCHLIECNTCGAEPYDEEFAHVHWPTLGDAQSMVVHFEFGEAGERDVWCEKHKYDPHEHIGSPTSACERCGNDQDDHLPVEQVVAR